MNWLGTCLVKEEGEVNVLSVTPGIVDSGQQREVREERESYSHLVTRHELLSDALPRPSKHACGAVQVALGPEGTGSTTSSQTASQCLCTLGTEWGSCRSERAGCILGRQQSSC